MTHLAEFQESPICKAALKKLAPVAEYFQFYVAGWLGKRPEDWHVMEVSGAEFRVAKSGPRKGERCVIVPGTRRTAYVTREEIGAEK